MRSLSGTILSPFWFTNLVFLCSLLSWQCFSGPVLSSCWRNGPRHFDIWSWIIQMAPLWSLNYNNVVHNWYLTFKWTASAYVMVSLALHWSLSSLPWLFLIYLVLSPLCYLNCSHRSPLFIKMALLEQTKDFLAQHSASSSCLWEASKLALKATFLAWSLCQHLVWIK